MLITEKVRNLASRIEKNKAYSAANVRALVAELEKNSAKPETVRRYLPLKDPTVLEPYPIDKDGYAVSFDPLTQEKEFFAAWQRYGMVVGKNIVPQEQCDKTVEAISAKFNLISSGKCDLRKPATWADIPKDANGAPLLSRGFLEIYHDEALAQLRQNVRAYLHHAIIWGRPDLWTSFDRVGVKLPKHEESKALPLHVDQNPNVHPGFKTVQGVLALTDCPADRGTFVGVPGSRGHFPVYAGMAKNGGEHVELDLKTSAGKELAKMAQAIPLRKGDMVSWDSRTTHANTENTSDKMRMVFYMAAGPAREDDANLVRARTDAFKSGVGENVREALMHASKKPRYSDIAVVNNFRTKEKLNLLGKLLYGTERYKKTSAPPAP